jgi:type IV pilus assembly protein PilE
MFSKSRGYTLTEMMVVVAIIGILAAIAYPSYTQHLATSRRADAQGALLGLAGAMERFYTVHSTYEGAATAEKKPASELRYSDTVPVSGGTATYELAIEDATANSFTVWATPVDVQAKDPCGTLTLTSAGVRGITDKPADSTMTKSDCWRN